MTEIIEIRSKNSAKRIIDQHSSFPLLRNKVICRDFNDIFQQIVR